MIYCLLFISWFKISITTFGGGYAMLPMIEKEIIEKRAWADSDDILKAYSIGQITPGIISVNTATFVGYKVKGFWGALAATLGIVAPAILLISICASVILQFYQATWLISALNGIKIAVCILLISSTYQMAVNSIKDRVGFLVFVIVLVLELFFNIGVLTIILTSVLIALSRTFLKRKLSSNNE
ncbi:MAG: chromate transporter [Erysipelotrichaceae bacterium]